MHNNMKANSQQALDRLMAGNERFASGQIMEPRRSSEEERAALLEGQNPIAVILGCADSRVSPTIIFDQDLGDLFVIRVAGNVVDKVVLGSIEFAVTVLNVPLVMVLGHKDCGAVKAAITEKSLPGHLSHLVEAIELAVCNIQEGKMDDLLDNAIQANAHHVAAKLRAAEPILAERVKTGQLNIVAAYYDLSTGKVELMP